MNELQIALIVVGVVAVGGILIYNHWQERRYRRQGEAGLTKPHRDVLMGQTSIARRPRRVEPELREPMLDAANTTSANPDSHEAGFSNTRKPKEAAFVSSVDANPPVSAPTLATDKETPTDHNERFVFSLVNPTHPLSPLHVIPDPATHPAPVAPPPLDELIEYQIKIKGDHILASLFDDVIHRSWTFSKPVRWIGLPVNGRAWEEVLPENEKPYQEVRVAMQLADRHGAVSEEILTALCKLVHETVAPHGLRVRCDDLNKALERARALDAFCAEVDVLIGINVVARGNQTLPMSKVRLEAKKAGMVLAADGTFRLLDNRGRLLYSLCNHESTPFSEDNLDTLETHGITLLFDVPCVPNGIQVFNNMVALCHRLAQEVGGLLVDDNLRPLTDTGIEKIRAQLNQLYDKMESHGIPAGGRLALRLFS